MKTLIAASVLALASLPAMAGDTVGPVDTTFASAQGVHPFNVRDLVMMERVGDPQLSPDGQYAAFDVRRTDYAANKGIHAIYLMKPGAGDKPVKVADHASTPRWSANGRSLYFMRSVNGVSQLWRVNLGKGDELALSAHADPVQVSHGPLDINDYKLSPDGKSVLLSYDVFTDCPTLACTQQRLDARKKEKASGTLYRKLFVRHWDTWVDGRRNQLFIGRFNDKSQLPAEPTLLSQGIDGDVPSKPFGDASEFSFSPDGKSVYFDARIAGKTEPWSTNFDVYSVPSDGSAAPKNLTAGNKAWDGYPVAAPDGKTLYYLAMKTPGFEADRFAIMAIDLTSGQKREVDPKWERSPGGLSISADGKTLYATVDDEGQHPLFAIDAASGKVSKVVGDGTVHGFSLAGGKLLLARDDLKRPADLYLADPDGSNLRQVTHFNAEDLKNAQVGNFEFFNFKGWHGQTVQGYVVKPTGYQPGKTYPGGLHHPWRPAGCDDQWLELPLESADLRRAGLCRGHDQLPRFHRLWPGLHRFDLRRLGRQAARRPEAGLEGGPGQVFLP